MSTSSQLGQIQGLPISTAIDDAACSTATMRALANNINHHADERSRILVSYPQRSTTSGGLHDSKAGAGVWRRLYSWGPFPVLVDHNGTPYPIRARVGGRASGGTCYLRIGACLQSRVDVEMQATTPGANIIESASFTSGTNAWRDPTVAKTTLILDATVLPTSYAIVDAVSSASPASVAAILIVIEVWGYASSGSVYCTQAYAAEQTTP